MDEKLRGGALWVAIMAATLALVSVFSSVAREIFIQPVLYTTIAAVFVLFMRIISCKAYRSGIANINLAMQGTDPWPGRGKKLSDPEWGLFGRNFGTPLILKVRAILFLGTIPAALMQNWLGPEIFYLWFAATFLSLELSLMYGALHGTSEEI
ncbi:hypothetical protein [uncultured Parasphingorhabdus sp.]|uniref:hypothetical protein n=1 Tax=uncultured Parasphingorhabdus sp. TaxID=2709694 RepID=UPI002AA8A19D|nr:hypothetical protein [uncultured Parasphingorhabdus sp.]